MEDDYQPITFSHFFHSFLILVFVWGLFWVGLSGKNIFFDKNNHNLSAIADYNKSLEQSISTTTATNIDKTIHSLPDQTITIMIAGDLMLDRGVRLIGQKYGYDSLFATITPLFKTADIVVVNLEGPITSNKSKTVLSNGKTNKELLFTFDPKSAKAIANSGISIVSLANNHIDNFGLSGIQETKKWLSENSIQWFGDYRNSSSTELVISKNGIDVAFVGYHAFQKGFDRVEATIKELDAKGYFTIVMPHWGEEYSTTTSSFIKSQARAMVIAGADAIVGAHPHVVQEKVWMGNVPIIYSLGNLLFDQHFSKEVMKGNILELKLVKNNNSISIDKARIYETSIASKRGIDVDMTPVDF